MKKILITGAAGFIGSHLTELCVEKGYKVRAFIHYNSFNHWGWLEDSKYRSEIEIVAGDIRDFDSVLSASEGCENILHLAALIGIPYSYVSPLAYIRTNVEGTYNVLQAAKMLNTEKVIVTSTSETYGTAQYVPIDEKHPLVGQSPYSATKISADQLAISYHRSFDLPVSIVRPFNTYGPRQSARAIIPTIISQVLDGNNKIQLGNLSPTRDLTYVEDTVKGFLSVLDTEELQGEVVNIGNNMEISIGDLANTIAVLMEESIEIIQEDQRIRPEQSEVERLFCDNTKIKQATGWSPEFDLNQGLKETIEWMRAHSGEYKSELYNV